ncbi:MAG: tRNA uridine-5-carboxymethylaminomethyl(34) synthesis GTPase MnmE, partial [Armatimonadota bacterium]
VLYLADRSQPRADTPDLLAPLPQERVLCLATKADLPAAWHDPAFLPVSSATGEGMPALLEAIHQRLLGEAPEGEVWISNERHAQALSEAKGHLLDALASPEDLMGLSIQAALEALNRILGKDVPEEVIDRVFRNFCVGK